MYYTTLRRLYDLDADVFDFPRLLRSLGKTAVDDEPLSLRAILESNGLDDAILALRAVDDPACARDARLFAVRCVRQSVQHLLTDQRSLDALDIAERHAVGEATDEELAAARADARDDVFNAAGAAAWTAREAAWEALAARAAWEDAWEAAEAAAWEAARDAQRQDFIDIFCA